MFLGNDLKGGFDKFFNLVTTTINNLTNNSTHLSENFTSVSRVIKMVNFDMSYTDGRSIKNP
jgi:hypothetical protein